MKSPKKAKLTNAYVAPEAGGLSAGLGFNTTLGNSQINGLASPNIKYIGASHTYPINNFMGVTGGANYANINYPGYQGSNLSGNLGLNYARSIGKNKNTDIDLTASLDLDKEGLAPGFNVGLVRKFPHGGLHIPQHILDGAQMLNNPLLRPGYTPIEPSNNTYQSDNTNQIPLNIRNLQEAENRARIQQENEAEQKRLAEEQRLAEEKIQAEREAEEAEHRKKLENNPYYDTPPTATAEPVSTAVAPPVVKKTQAEEEEEERQYLYGEFKKRTGMDLPIDHPYVGYKMQQYADEVKREEERLARGDYTRQEYFHKMAQEKSPNWRSYAAYPGRLIFENPFKLVGDVFNPLLPGPGLFPDSGEDIYWDTYNANYDPNQQGYYDEDGKYHIFYDVAQKSMGARPGFVEDHKRIEEERSEDMLNYYLQQKENVELGALIELGTFGLGHGYNALRKLGKTPMGKFRQDLAQDAIAAESQFARQRRLAKELQEESLKKEAKKEATTVTPSTSLRSPDSPAGTGTQGSTEIVRVDGELQEIPLGSTPKRKLKNKIKDKLPDKVTTPKEEWVATDPNFPGRLENIADPNRTSWGSTWLKASDVRLTQSTGIDGLLNRAERMDSREFNKLLDQFELQRKNNTYASIRGTSEASEVQRREYVRNYQSELHQFDETSPTGHFLQDMRWKRNDIVMGRNEYANMSQLEKENALRNIRAIENRLDRLKRVNDIPDEVLDPVGSAITRFDNLTPAERQAQLDRANQFLSSLDNTPIPSANPGIKTVPVNTEITAVPQNLDNFRFDGAADQFINQKDIAALNSDAVDWIKQNPNMSMAYQRFPQNKTGYLAPGENARVMLTDPTKPKARQKIQSISLNTFEDRNGKLYYYYSSDMPTSTMAAGKAMRALEELVPPGGVTVERYSLSSDSFQNVMSTLRKQSQLKTRQAAAKTKGIDIKGPKYEPYTEHILSPKDRKIVNNFAKHKKFPGQLEVGQGGGLTFVDEKQAQDAADFFNRLLDKTDVPKDLRATIKAEGKIKNIVAGPYKPHEGKMEYKIEVPNIGMKKLYALLGITAGGGAAGEALAEPQQQAYGGPITTYAEGGVIPQQNQYSFDDARYNKAIADGTFTGDVNDYVIDNTAIPKLTYGNGGAISPDDSDYNTFVKTLPSNLRGTDTSTYNLRGYWEALGKPAKFDYSQPKEADGHYHAFSRNPQTGEILKKENHPTFRMAIEGDMQAGYTPYKNKTTGKIHTFNEEPDMSKFEVYNTAPLYDNLYLAQGGSLMPYMFPPQMKGGGQFWSKFGAGATGALQGVAGSLLPGAAGDWAVKGIGAVHGMIDKDVTDADRAIMGGARAVGAGVTAVATGGATLAAGADDMVVGTKDAVKHGTEWGQKNAGALDVVGNLAGTVAGGAAGGAAGGGGMQGALQGAGQSLMPGQTGAGSTFTGGTAGNTGGFTGQQNINGSNNINMDNIMGMFAGQGQPGMGGGMQGGINPQQIMQFAQMFNQANGGPILMGNGGLTAIENGGTHEQNPMGGVPVGPNALVEEGETIMDLKDQVEGGKFVFSDRKGPKGNRGSTWADISKRIERKYKDRENDAAAKRAMDQELLKVAEAQEAQKAAEIAKLKQKLTELDPTALPPLPPQQGMTAGAPQGPQGMGQGMPQIPGQTPPNLPPMPQGMPGGMPQTAAGGGVLYNMGGMLYAPGGKIKYGNGGGWAGLFNHGQAWDLAGMQDYADANKLDWTQLGAEAKKAGLNLGDIGAAGSTNRASFGPKTLAAINALQGNQAGAGTGGNQGGNQGTLPYITPPPMPPGPSNKLAKSITQNQPVTLTQANGANNFTNTNVPFTGGEPYQAPYGSVALGHLGNSLGDMHSIYTGLFNKGDVPELGRMDPKHIDLHAQRQSLRKQAGNSLESVRQGMRKAGDISSLVAAHSTLDENLGQGLSKSYSDEENYNNMLDNKAQEYNLGKGDTEQMLAIQRDEAAKQQVNQGLHGLGENIGQGFKDIRDHQAVDERNRMQIAAINATSPDFNWDQYSKMLQFVGGQKTS